MYKVVTFEDASLNFLPSCAEKETRVVLYKVNEKVNERLTERMLDLFPAELVIQILSGLPTETLIRLSRTARKWHQIVSHSASLWSSVRIAENRETVMNVDALTLVCSFVPTSQLVDLDFSGCSMLTAEIVPILLTDCPALVRLSLKGCQGIDLAALFLFLSSNSYDKPLLPNLALRELSLSMTRIRGVIVYCGNTSPHRLERKYFKALGFLLGGGTNQGQERLHFDVFPCSFCEKRLAPFATRHCGATPDTTADYVCQSCAETMLWTCAACDQVSFCPDCSHGRLVPIKCGLSDKNHHHHSAPLRVCQPP